MSATGFLLLIFAVWTIASLWIGGDLRRCYLWALRKEDLQAEWDRFSESEYEESGVELLTGDYQAPAAPKVESSLELFDWQAEGVFSEEGHYAPVVFLERS